MMLFYVYALIFSRMENRQTNFVQKETEALGEASNESSELIHLRRNFAIFERQDTSI
jgi:hypothetical protein